MCDRETCWFSEDECTADYHDALMLDDAELESWQDGDETAVVVDWKGRATDE